MSDKPKVIPLHESDIPFERAGKMKAQMFKLSGDRTILVGEKRSGKRFIQIRRPDHSGNVEETAFALSEEAAFALLLLLEESFERKPVKSAKKAKPTKP